MHIKNKRGQSTVEYVLLVTAVVAVMIAFSTGSNSSFKTQLNSALNSVASDMNTMASSLAGSQKESPYGSGAKVTPPYSVGVNISK